MAAVREVANAYEIYVGRDRIHGPDVNMISVTVQSIIAKAGISNELLSQYYMELPNVKISCINFKK